jgi:UDP-3-O-[3-hydroxymyristoyl] N-acetylglucosamine deacetylase
MDAKAFIYQPLLHQATVGGIVHFSGKAGFLSDDASIEIRPAEPDTGIAFVNKKSRIQALINYQYPSQFRTTSLLTKNGSDKNTESLIVTVEHVLSAISGLGITNCEINVGDNGLIPFMDGSANDFCNRILEVGIKTQDKYYRRALYVQRDIRVDHDDAFMEAKPPTTDGLTIFAIIDFPEPIGKQEITYFNSPLSYCLNVAWARTFATKEFESEELTRKHMPIFALARKFRGSYVEAPMLVFKRKRFITSVRRVDEHIRHKVLDFIGDLALLGYDLYADVYLHKSGHKLNWEFVKKLNSELQNHAVSIATKPGGPVQSKYEGDKSRYVKDVTLLDGETFPPNKKIIKTWEIANVGTVSWNGRRLLRIGPCKGFGVINSDPITDIPTTQPGNTVQISIEIETPDLQGHYIAEWKMIDENGDLVFPNRKPLSVVLRVG